MTVKDPEGVDHCGGGGVGVVDDLIVVVLSFLVYFFVFFLGWFCADFVLQKKMFYWLFDAAKSRKKSWPGACQ